MIAVQIVVGAAPEEAGFEFDALAVPVQCDCL